MICLGTFVGLGLRAFGRRVRDRLGARGGDPGAVAYEAGPSGFGLARFLTCRSVRCIVAALSKIKRTPDRLYQVEWLMR